MRIVILSNPSVIVWFQIQQKCDFITAWSYNNQLNMSKLF